MSFCGAVQTGKIEKKKFRIYRIFRTGIFKSMFWTFWAKRGLTSPNNQTIWAFLESSRAAGSDKIGLPMLLFHVSVRIFQNVIRKSGYQKLIEGVI